MNNMYVTGFNGARDGYNFPLALYEAGMLTKHVGDIYLPDFFYELTHKFNLRVSSRYCRNLPASCVQTDWKVFGLEFIRRFNFTKKGHKNNLNEHFKKIDDSISRMAAEVAIKSDSNLALYSGYALQAFKLNPSKKKILFQYHPAPALGYSILRDDFEKFSEIEHSFNAEAETSGVDMNSDIEEALLADMVLCASGYTKRSLIASGCPDHKIHIVPYGIDFSDKNICYIKKNYVNNKIRFIFVGQGVQRKGLHHLLRVWKNVKNLNVELHLVLNRVDPGLVDDINSSGAFVYKGLTGSELVNLYKACDIFVMPSIVEGFGLVYLEALGHGLICIGGVNSGLPDLQLSDEFSKVCDAGDLAMLERSMIDAYKSIVFGRVCRNDVIRAIENLSWSNYRNGIVKNIKNI